MDWFLYDKDLRHERFSFKLLFLLLFYGFLASDLIQVPVQAM